MNYWNETRFDERMRFEDKKGRIWEPEDLDKIAPWELEKMGLHVAEAE